jgi:hypothetical protein
MNRQVVVRVAAKGSPLIDKTVELLSRTIRERCGLEVQPAKADSAAIVLDVRPGIGTEGFRIEDGPAGQVRVVGNDDRGLLYGVGKLLRTSRLDPGRMTPGAWRGTSVPKTSVRGMYFASHFHNFYHDAPIPDVQRYVEELALWGCNALSVWFDMHHFRGLADPAAQEMLHRLRAILKAGKAVGIRPGLTSLANEAYADSPEHLRADWTAGHDGYHHEPGGHYHVEVCPNKPGGLEYILGVRQEMLEAFADLGIEYVWMWPYDQGGCTCSQCTPWGAKGFLECCRPYGELIRRLMPQAKRVLSTWYFDHFVDGEWQGLDRAIGKTQPDFAEYLMADDYGDRFPEYPIQHGVPGGLPMINFPEISMYNMFPWGGYGANPLPRHIQRIWDSAGAHLAGGFPYSEGIFEDLNKAVCFQHYWSGRDAMDTVREYLAYEGSPDAVDEAARAVEIMEAQHGRSSLTVEGRGRQLHAKIFPTTGRVETPMFNLPDLSRAGECLNLIRAAESKLTPRARQAWRWRVLSIRAELDAIFHLHGGKPGEDTERLFDELAGIYHARQADWVLCPPSRKALWQRQA